MSGKFFGKSTNMGSSSSSPPTSSSSSRRSKKAGSEKPVKQPQRGLGVAQLEKIRMHEEMGSCFNQLPSTNNFIHGDPRVLTAFASSMAPPSLSSSVPSYTLQQNFPMGLNEYGTTNIMYGDFQPTTPTSWRPESGNMSETLQFSQPNMDNKQFLRPNIEVQEYSWERRSKTRLTSDSFASQRSGSSENNQEIDLELRLSL